VSAQDLDRDIRAELRGLSPINADVVARRLVMATRLLEDDPESAYRHALAAQRSAGRVGVVREAVGLAAYAAGHYAEALAELRAARRITGSSSYLPVMADCERGVGRPEKALALAGSTEAGRLDPAGRVEMRIVAAGARRDLGQADAAVVTLQGPDLVPRRPAPWTARLRYAYADALLAAGRGQEALDWFRRAADVDTSGDTDAADRVAELEGVVFQDLEVGVEPSAGDADEQVPGSGGSDGDG
jgi:tetratricopeptide (TPR) repeat protein